MQALQGQRARQIHRHCGTLGLPASPLSASGRGRLPGDFGPRAFCRGSLAPPARGPEGPGRWRCEDRGRQGAGRRAQARGAGTVARRPQHCGKKDAGAQGAGRRPGARGAGLEALWRAGNRTVARRPQFRDAGPRDNAREPRSGDIPTPRKASQTALRGPRSMVSARGPKPPIPGKGRNFGGLGPLPRKTRGLRAPSRQYAKRLGVAIFLGVA